MQTFFLAIAVAGAAATFGRSITELYREPHPGWLVSAILSFAMGTASIIQLCGGG